MYGIMAFYTYLLILAFYYIFRYSINIILLFINWHYKTNNRQRKLKKEKKNKVEAIYYFKSLVSSVSFFLLKLQEMWQINGVLGLALFIFFVHVLKCLCGCWRHRSTPCGWMLSASRLHYNHRGQSSIYTGIGLFLSSKPSSGTKMTVWHMGVISPSFFNFVHLMQQNLTTLT